MDEAKVSYYASGIRSIEIGGVSVPVEQLVQAWQARDDECRHEGMNVDAVIRQRDEAVKLVEKLKAHLATRSRERDEAVRKLTCEIERSQWWVNEAGKRLVRIVEVERERDEAVNEAERLMARRNEGAKRLWLVRRTDAAGKPGEYGKVIVWARDETDAVDVVMWSGYGGHPMYGYRDRDHTTVVALEYGDEADDQIVVAETLR